MKGLPFMPTKLHFMNKKVRYSRLVEMVLSNGHKCEV